MVYFLQAEEGGAIKVGKTICLSGRLQGYKQEYGIRFRVLGVMDGGRPEEKAILERFAHLRISESVVSEWFDPAEDLMEFIRERTQVWDGRDDEPPTKKAIVVTYQCNAETAPAIRAWLKELADFSRQSVTSLIDQAIRAYAEQEGFTKPMPTRFAKRRRI